MASTISAGLTTTTSLVYTADTSGVLQLQTNGTTTAVTIDTSQRVGIGTSSPSYQLQVDSSTNANTVSINSSNTTYGVNFALNYSGSGIGSLGSSKGIDSSQSITDLGFNANNNMTFATGYTTRMKLDTSGNLLVGKTSTPISGSGCLFGNDGKSTFTGSYSTNANDTLDVYSSGASAYRFYVDMGGTIHATSTSISAISDQTLKTNIKPLETGLSEINRLQPRRFDWLNGDGTNVAGFVSQEVQQVLPDLVEAFKYNLDENGNRIDKLGLKMGDMIPTMVKAIQELSAQVTALQTEVAQLQGAK